MLQRKPPVRNCGTTADELVRRVVSAAENEKGSLYRQTQLQVVSTGLSRPDDAETLLTAAVAGRDGAQHRNASIVPFSAEVLC